MQELEKEFGEKRVLYIKTDVLDKQQFEGIYVYLLIPTTNNTYCYFINHFNSVSHLKKVYNFDVKQIIIKSTTGCLHYF